MSEPPFAKKVIWFVTGCAVTVAAFVLVILPIMRQSARIEDVTNQSLRFNLKQVTDQRDTCVSKFDRATVLYDVGLFNVETKAWVIPADVEPVLVTGKNGTYSHYDPKAQTETVHFKGNPAK